MTFGSFSYPDWWWPVIFWAAISIFAIVVIIQALRPKYRRLYGVWAPLVALRNALLPSIFAQIYMWLALIVLWTPVWWLSVMASHFTGISTATGWFLSAFVAFYGLWFLRGIAGLSVGRKFDAAKDAAPPSAKKRVAVVGAGMAGLVAAKELKDEGHEVVVFEKTKGPGGVWAASKQKGGVSWGLTMTSTGALNSTLSDMVSKVYHPEHPKWPRHFSRDQFHQLLQDYDQAHNVFDGSLRVETEITGMEMIDGQRWKLSVRDHAKDKDSTEDFDAVTICSGLNKQAFTPEYKGQDLFTGTQKHVEDYRPEEAPDYKGKRVLVVGLGETSSDLIKDLTDNGAEKIYVSQRGPTFVIPRDVANLPADHVETRLAHDGPMFHRFTMIFAVAGSSSMFPTMRNYRIRPAIFGHMWKISILNHPSKWNLWRLGSFNWTKSDNVYRAMDTGRVDVLRDIDRFETNSVIFADGTEKEIDAVIYASGYRTGPSLLPQIKGAEAPMPRNGRDLYKLTIPPHHPNVAIIGYARGQIGAITVSSEIQARWWALLVSGKRTLPPENEMAKSMERMRENGRRFHQSNRTTGTFAYSIARDEIGCEPDMFKLFFGDLRLWHAVFLGPVCSAHFRLRGHGARPQKARDQVLMPNAIQSSNYIDSLDLYANTLPLAVFLLPAYGFYSWMLPGFVFQNATRCYI